MWSTPWSSRRHPVRQRGGDLLALSGRRLRRRAPAGAGALRDRRADPGRARLGGRERRRDPRDRRASDRHPGRYHRSRRPLRRRVPVRPEPRARPRVVWPSWLARRGEVISHVGARPTVPLADLAAELLGDEKGRAFAQWFPRMGGGGVSLRGSSVRSTTGSSTSSARWGVSSSPSRAVWTRPSSAARPRRRSATRAVLVDRGLGDLSGRRSSRRRGGWPRSSGMRHEVVETRELDNPRVREERAQPLLLLQGGAVRPARARSPSATGGGAARLRRQHGRPRRPPARAWRRPGRRACARR